MPGQLQTELRQTRPFSTLEEEALVSIARTSAVLEHALAARFAEYGITTTQYNVLRILRGAGPEGLCRTEVGQRMVNRVPDVTRLLDRLEEAGWVSRSREHEDRRFVTTRITRAGVKLLNQLDQPLHEFLAQWTAGLTQAQLRSLVDALAAIRGSLPA